MLNELYILIKSFFADRFVITSKSYLRYLFKMYPARECRTTCSGKALSAIKIFFFEFNKSIFNLLFLINFLTSGYIVNFDILLILELSYNYTLNFQQKSIFIIIWTDIV